MSHLRDIHKLRNNPNISTNQQSAERFSRPQKPDIFNVNFDRFVELPSSSTQPFKFNQTYIKLNDSREPISVREKRVHHRGSSNISGHSEQQQPKEIMSPGLSIYQYSSTMTTRPSNSVSSKRQRPQSRDIVMPESDCKQDRKLSQAMNQKIGKNNFGILYPVGKGGFGKVWKVQYKKTGEIMAMKEMYKAKIIQKKSINSVMNERKLLAKLNHPFIINMVCAFQTRENLYLIMDYINGGDLRYHIGRRRRFTQNQTKFFLANMIIGLEYLHRNKVIHRDMKPENMVFDSDGYLRITDLGISRQWREQNHQDTSGTPGYMSPEVICRKNHKYTADFFAVGIMGYEFMLGRRPYVGKNRKQIRDQILSKQAAVKAEDLPNKWTPEAADCINKLLIRNPANRLGAQGIDQVKNHPWFASVDWKKLLKKEMKAPYIPLKIEDNYQDYKEQISQDTVDENLQQNLLMLRDREVQSLFEDYYVDREETERKRRCSYSSNNFYHR